MARIILGIALIALFLTGAMSTIFSVGKPRTPITPGLAAFAALVDFVLIVWIILVM